LETLGGALKAKLPKLSKEIKDRQDELVNAVNGLTMVEAQNAFTKSIVIHRKFDIPTILNIKKQIIRRKGILEFYETDLTMADVGGLRNMVQWFERRKLAFHSNAKAYGLPAPKGVMAIGFPGTGKSLIAKAAASLYEMPLLRLDFGRLFNSLVGESERTARDAIKIAESLAPCILGSTVLDIGVDGSSRTIESLFDQFYKESKDIKTFEDGTIIAGNNSRLRSKTINLNNGQEMDTNLKSIIRRPAITRNLIKISTEDSHQITVTENHKILVEEDGKRIWKEAKDLKEGDDIITL
jgi:SpoVK/Ycf46/Vps4 family AAA+-type ATPase